MSAVANKRVMYPNKCALSRKHLDKIEYALIRTHTRRLTIELHNRKITLKKKRNKTVM